MRTMTELAQKLEIQQDQQLSQQQIRIPIAKQRVIRSLTKSHKKTLRVSHISLWKFYPCLFINVINVTADYWLFLLNRTKLSRSIIAWILAFISICQKLSRNKKKRLLRNCCPPLRKPLIPQWMRTIQKSCRL